MYKNTINFSVVFHVVFFFFSFRCEAVICLLIKKKKNYSHHNSKKKKKKGKCLYEYEFDCMIGGYYAFDGASI